MKEDQYLVTGCSDAELRVWKLSLKDPDSENKKPLESLALNLESISIEDNDDYTVCSCIGFQDDSLVYSQKNLISYIFSTHYNVIR